MNNINVSKALHVVLQRLHCGYGPWGSLQKKIFIFFLLTPGEDAPHLWSASPVLDTSLTRFFV